MQAKFGIPPLEAAVGWLSGVNRISIQLYMVRDQLIYLVATDQIREDDFVFQRFYKAINYFMDTIDHINLRALTSAIESARHKGIDPAEEKNWSATAMRFGK